MSSYNKDKMSTKTLINAFEVMAKAAKDASKCKEKMPHEAVYSQPFKQNICITRICSLHT